jgi:hypothetical protein
MQIYKNYPDDKVLQKNDNLNAIIEQEALLAEKNVDEKSSFINSLRTYLMTTMKTFVNEMVEQSSKYY